MILFRECEDRTEKEGVRGSSVQCINREEEDSNSFRYKKPIRNFYDMKMENKS